MMIASEQANFDAHDWTGQLMLTNEQANFHHGFGRAWRQICQPIHITARKKKPRERIAIPAVNLQNLKLVHIVAIAKNDTASAQKEARVRGTFVSEIRKNTKFSSFGEPQKKKSSKKKTTTTKGTPGADVTKPWF